MTVPEPSATPADSEPRPAEPAKPATPAAGEPLLSVRDLVQEFTVRERGGGKVGVVQAVSGVSFDIMPGETLGIVGETGSGKSTLARAILQAPRPKSGSVTFRGTELTKLRGGSLLQARRHMQFVFQDPFGSLDPKWKVRSIVEEPLVAYHTGGRAARRKRVNELLDLVGMDPARYAKRHPRELSGGQAQRVAIARAVALEPSLLICDEAVSSLDVLIQAQVLNLFERLRAELGLSYLFIAHDLALVKQVSDRVAVMYLGKLCETGPGEAVYREPLHPYTRALLDSIPSTEPGAARASSVIQGEPPSPINPPSGCRFRTRCPRATDLCAEEEPRPRELARRPRGGLSLPADRAAPRRVGGKHVGGERDGAGRRARRQRDDVEGGAVMRLRVLLEPHHGATYAQIRDLAQAAEQGGFDAFFRSDHYLGIDANDTTYQPTDSWTTLAGLALQTERVRIGTLVNASTFRLPGQLAVEVATVDQMSGGRAELGIGAAWYEREHQYFGIPFPPLGERFDRLEEQLAILTGIWDTRPGERFSFDGKHYQVQDCVSIPRWASRPKIIIGGAGAKRTPTLAARYADEFNGALGLDVRERYANFRRICQDVVGRDPAEVRLSATLPVCIGSDPADLERRKESLGEPGARLLAAGVTGTAGDVIRAIEDLAGQGADTVYFHLYGPGDVEHVRLLGSEVVSRFLPEAVPPLPI